MAAKLQRAACCESILIYAATSLAVISYCVCFCTQKYVAFMKFNLSNVIGHVIAANGSLPH